MRERWTVRWFRKRALLYHLIVAILAPGCLYAGWWQIGRAESGNTLSYLYSVEWPIFAVLSVVGWWQLIHEDPAAVESRKVERARRAAHRGPYIPPAPETESGFYHPLQPGSRAAIAPAGDERDRQGLALLQDADGSDAAPGGGSVEVHALSSYNAYLARLSAGGGRKSWRNPRGIPVAVRDADPSPAVTARPAPTVIPAGPSPTAVPARPSPSVSAPAASVIAPAATDIAPAATVIGPAATVIGPAATAVPARPSPSVSAPAATAVPARPSPSVSAPAATAVPARPSPSVSAPAATAVPARPSPSVSAPAATAVPARPSPSVGAPAATVIAPAATDIGPAATVIGPAARVIARAATEGPGEGE